MKFTSLLSWLLLGMSTAYGNFTFGTTLPASVGDIFTVQASCCFLDQPFTLTQFFTLDQISVDLGGFSASPFTIWLTNAVGPSATVGNVLFQNNFTSPNTSSSLNVQVENFATSLILGPGTYFIVMSSTSTSSTDGWGADNSLLGTNSTIGSVGIFQQADVSNSNVVDNAFPPASGFVNNPLNEDLAFQISGQIGAPEPATWLLCAAGLGLAAWKRRRLV